MLAARLDGNGAPGSGRDGAGGGPGTVPGRMQAFADPGPSGRPRVAVVGHIEWVDFVSLPRYPAEGEVAHAEGWSARVGGGGGVAAVVLADMGAEVDFFLALGRDAHGKATVHQLEERGVRPHVAWREGEMTRRAITYLSTGGERTIVTIGRRLEPRGEDDLDWDRLRSADGVYFTAGDPGALARARAARVLTASPRGREALEGSREALEGSREDLQGSRDAFADGAEALERGAEALERGAEALGEGGEGPRLDALIFSQDDAHEREWAERLESRARLMVATQGEHGGRWWGEAGEGRWAAVPAPGPPRDAYGCGDSFAAAFTYGLAAGASISEAARMGAERGAFALTRVGAP